MVAGVTLWLCACSDACGRQFGLLDIPDHRKRHGRVTPLMGGLAILVAILPVSLWAMFVQPNGAWNYTFFLYVGGTFVMTLVGLADDRRTLSASYRVVIGLATFAGLAYVEPSFAIRSLAFTEPRHVMAINHLYISAIFTTICCVGLVNAVNMADGKNGLVIGLLLGWLAFICLRAPPPLAALCLILMAALIVLLFFNLQGILFLGDGGTYGFTAAMALVTIATYNSPGPYLGHAIAAEQIVCLFAIPVLDSFRLTYTRLRAGRSPMSPDRDHLHHHLQDSLGWPRGLFAYWGLGLGPAVIGSTLGISALIVFGLAILAYGIVLAAYRPPELQRDG